MASSLLTESQRDAVFETIVDTSNAVVLPRFQNLSAGEVDTKSSPTDLVTVADREAEVRLSAALTSILPGSLVVGEEGVSADPSILNAINHTSSLFAAQHLHTQTYLLAIEHRRRGL